MRVLQGGGGKVTCAFRGATSSAVLTPQTRDGEHQIRWAGILSWQHLKHFMIVIAATHKLRGSFVFARGILVHTGHASTTFAEGATVLVGTPAKTSWSNYRTSDRLLVLFSVRWLHCNR
jgi:hypothetical protein